MGLRAFVPAATIGLSFRLILPVASSCSSMGDESSTTTRYALGLGVWASRSRKGTIARVAMMTFDSHKRSNWHVHGRVRTLGLLGH